MIINFAKKVKRLDFRSWELHTPFLIIARTDKGVYLVGYNSDKTVSEIWRTNVTDRIDSQTPRPDWNDAQLPPVEKIKEIFPELFNQPVNFISKWW